MCLSLMRSVTSRMSDSMHICWDCCKTADLWRTAIEPALLPPAATVSCADGFLDWLLADEQSLPKPASSGSLLGSDPRKAMLGDDDDEEGFGPEFASMDRSIDAGIRRLPPGRGVLPQLLGITPHDASWAGDGSHGLLPVACSSGQVYAYLKASDHVREAAIRYTDAGRPFPLTLTLCHHVDTTSTPELRCFVHNGRLAGISEVEDSFKPCQLWSTRAKRHAMAVWIARLWDRHIKRGLALDSYAFDIRFIPGSSSVMDDDDDEDEDVISEDVEVDEACADGEACGHSHGDGHGHSHGHGRAHYTSPRQLLQAAQAALEGMKPQFTHVSALHPQLTDSCLFEWPELVGPGQAAGACSRHGLAAEGRTIQSVGASDGLQGLRDAHKIPFRTSTSSPDAARHGPRADHGRRAGAADESDGSDDEEEQDEHAGHGPVPGRVSFPRLAHHAFPDDLVDLASDRLAGLTGGRGGMGGSGSGSAAGGQSGSGHGHSGRADDIASYALGRLSADLARAGLPHEGLDDALDMASDTLQRLLGQMGQAGMGRAARAAQEPRAAVATAGQPSTSAPAPASAPNPLSHSHAGTLGGGWQAMIDSLHAQGLFVEGGQEEEDNEGEEEEEED